MSGSENSHSNRAAATLAQEAASFLTREAGPESLITVTRAELSQRGERAIVFISVFPEDRIPGALFFLDRQRSAFSEHLKKHTRLRPIPRITFLPENGEM